MDNLVFTFEDGSQALAHHGIKGMKWGVRRYQNADGSLTSAGQRRYGGSSSRGGMSETTKRRLKTAAKVAGGAAAAGLIGYAAYKGAGNYLNRANAGVKMYKDAAKANYYLSAKAARNVTNRDSIFQTTVANAVSGSYATTARKHTQSAMKIVSSPKYKASSAYVKAVNRGKNKVHNMITNAGARRIERQSARNYKKYVKNLPHNSFGTHKRVKSGALNSDQLRNMGIDVFEPDKFTPYH